MRMTDEASKRFILENYIPVRDFYTGDIVAIKSEWDGSVFTRDISPESFDEVVRILEAPLTGEKRSLWMFLLVGQHSGYHKL